MKTLKTAKITTLILSVALVLCFVACNTVDKTGIWEDATYLSDKEFGSGSKTVAVEVCAADQSVTFTIHTDKTMLGDALTEHELIEGDEGEFGLYVKKVNGMLADFNVTGTYWALSKDGTMLMTGVDSTPIEDGAHYELSVAK